MHHVETENDTEDTKQLQSQAKTLKNDSKWPEDDKQWTHRVDKEAQNDNIKCQNKRNKIYIKHIYQTKLIIWQYNSKACVLNTLYKHTEAANMVYMNGTLWILSLKL